MDIEIAVKYGPGSRFSWHDVKYRIISVCDDKDFKYALLNETKNTAIFLNKWAPTLSQIAKRLGVNESDLLVLEHKIEMP
jgi:precorrin-6B methylase 1